MKRILHQLATSCIFLLCLLLFGCSVGSHTDSRNPLHVSNQANQDFSIWIVTMEEHQVPVTYSYDPSRGTEILTIQTPVGLLKDYRLTADADFTLPVSVSDLKVPLYLCLKDSFGHYFFYALDELSEPQSYFKVTLQLEDELPVFAIDWGDGALQMVYPALSSNKQYQEYVRWSNWGVVSYDDISDADFWLTKTGYTSQKWLRVYGSADSSRYTSEAQASSHMVRISFPVWNLVNGQKIASTASLWIHASLADDVVNIFTEIFNDPEQFPINSVGGYNWRGDFSSSQHKDGLAIDINPTENYEIRNGTIISGSFWDPSSSPYSISEESSVVRIFRKYGWSWGGNAWAGYTEPADEGHHDYMHFSYLGT